MSKDPNKIVSGVIYAFNLAGDVANALTEDQAKTCTDIAHIQGHCRTLSIRFEQHTRKAGQNVFFALKDSKALEADIQREYKNLSTEARIVFLEKEVKPKFEKLMPAWQLKIAALICRLEYEG